MYGFTARWSLAGAPEGVEDALRDYVHHTSLARFTGLEGLRFKTWRMRAGEWFEGTYVFADRATRDAFAAQFARDAAGSPGSRLVGAPPQLQETWEVVAVAQGGAGFAAGPGPGEG